MFCTKCGAQNSDGAAFCVSCGNNLQAQGVQAQPQVQYQPQGYANQPNMYAPQQNAYTGYARPTNKKGLMIGLIIGGVVLLAGIIVLIVVLTGGGSANNGILGTWYEQTGFGGTITFNANGTFDMNVMGGTYSGNYTYDPKTRDLEMTVEGSSVNCYVENGSFDLEGATYTKDYVVQQSLDLSDFNLSDFGLD